MAFFPGHSVFIARTAFLRSQGRSGERGGIGNPGSLGQPPGVSSLHYRHAAIFNRTISGSTSLLLSMQPHGTRPFLETPRHYSSLILLFHNIGPAVGSALSFPAHRLVDCRFPGRLASCSTMYAYEPTAAAEDVGVGWPLPCCPHADLHHPLPCLHSAFAVLGCVLL